MKRFTFLLLFLGLLLSTSIYAQLPNVPYVDYSTKTGTLTDPRDGKTYAYKTYGTTQWFMQNLNWDGYDGINETSRGTVGAWGSADPDGSKFGRFYPQANAANVCPQGWASFTKADLANLVKDISAEYDLPLLRDSTTRGYVYQNVLRYMRGGNMKANADDGLWESGTGILDLETSNKTQFNILPMGEFDGTGYAPGFEVGKRTWFLVGKTNERFRSQHNGTTEVSCLKHVNITASQGVVYGGVRCMRTKPVEEVEIKTPYPTTLEISQIIGAEVEKRRLRQNALQYDYILTGFYVHPGKKLNIKVENLVAANDGAQMQLIIGTINQRKPLDAATSQKVIKMTLSEGDNFIDASKHEGGMIYFRYVSQKAGEQPTGKQKVTFLSDSEQIRAPYYILGVTGEDEFKYMMDIYADSPEVMYSSDYIAAVTSRNDAATYSSNIDKKIWFAQLHKLLEIQDDISGLNNNDPNPVHHRLTPGQIRYFMVHTASGASPNSADLRTAYPGADRYLKFIQTPTNGSTNGAWMMAHEIGHQHQQNAYLIPQSGDATNNIYSIKVMEHFNPNSGDKYIRTSDVTFEKIEKYLALSDARRYYEMDNDSIKEIVGINRDETRMVAWEQMLYIFGDNFYKTLHRIVREEEKSKLGDDDSKMYLIYTASRVTGWDLRSFYHAWGIRVKDAYNQNKLDEMFAALETPLPIPERAEDLPYVTGAKFYNGDYAGWLPLKLQGITTSVPGESNDQPLDELASKEKYTDYSTSTGKFVDLRDNKEYTYKKYGEYDWFTQNLDYVDERMNVPASVTMPVYPSSIYSPNDLQGKVYGRMYVTYAGVETYEGWCPEGWVVPGVADWNTLYGTIKTEYSLDDISLASAMVSGGDRDNVEDGLWAKGPMGEYASDEQRKNVGFNILPSGVYNIADASFDNGDNTGSKASFFEPYFEWYHQAFSAVSPTATHPNRNARHYGTIRCMRLADQSGIEQGSGTVTLRVYANAQTIYVDATASFNKLVNSTINVYNTLGTKVSSVKVKDVVTPITTTTGGVYLIQVISENTKQNFKVIVK